MYTVTRLQSQHVTTTIQSVKIRKVHKLRNDDSEKSQLTATEVSLNTNTHTCLTSYSQSEVVINGVDFMFSYVS